ncbi:zinc-finger domain-containing protein [Armillaria novae-zelandiae]|uniref:Zinc-finger domain-containing protein n=1 Tax=Armillaria novae-zelandiae TaxID=153914 RepID=A0AA39P694_9AGAR|nr:zinc-finger domain-containing protein [Armillaria novae-zelandiae]
MLGRRLLQARPSSSLSTIAKALARSNSTAATPAPAAASNPLAAQAPNFPTTWSANQQPRPLGQSNPRFEQTAMETQPAPLSAMQLISEEPIRLVDGRKAVCDGGNGPLGHPKIYINLDQAGPRSCGYCGLRFQQNHHAH